MIGIHNFSSLFVFLVSPGIDSSRSLQSPDSLKLPIIEGKV